MGSNFSLQLLFRATRDGFDNSKFHSLCDNKGPLLVIIKTQKDLLIGGFCSISWKNSGGWQTDHQSLIFSISRQKIYNKLNDSTSNLYFDSDNGLHLGNGAI
jgi:hypothetical protein